MLKKILLALMVIFSMVLRPVHATVFQGWQKHFIGPQKTPIYLYVKDMDGDGDFDIASTTNKHPFIYLSEVAWFENNLSQNAPWEKRIIGSKDFLKDPIADANGIVIADINSDGLEDVVVATGAVMRPQGSIYWYKAPADPDEEWERFVVEPEVANTYYKVYAFDADHNGLQDIIAGGAQGACLFVNPGDAGRSEASWKKVALPDYTGASVYLEDMDDSGTLDIVNSSTTLGNVSWLSVDFDNGKFLFNENMIDPELEGAFDINCMDVNDDLRNDVLVTTFMEPNIYWYKAPESPDGPWTRQIVTDTYEGTDLYTGDIDGDNKTDFIVAGLFTYKISWFSYSTETEQWTEHVLDDAIDTPGDISLDDLDQDGDLDVVLAGMGVDQIIWYENKLNQQTDYPCRLISIIPQTLTSGRFLPKLHSVTITGENTNFTNESEIIFQNAEGVSVLYKSAASGDKMTALVAVTPKTLPGEYPVRVITEDVECAGIAAFIIK